MRFVFFFFFFFFFLYFLVGGFLLILALKFFRCLPPVPSLRNSSSSSSNSSRLRLNPLCKMGRFDADAVCTRQTDRQMGLESRRKIKWNFYII